MSVQREIQNASGNAFVLSAALTNLKEIERAVKSAAECGTLAVPVCRRQSGRHSLDAFQRARPYNITLSAGATAAAVIRAARKGGNVTHQNLRLSFIY